MSTTIEDRQAAPHLAILQHAEEVTVVIDSNGRRLADRACGVCP